MTSPSRAFWMQSVGLSETGRLGVPHFERDYYLVVRDHTGALISITQSLAAAERAGSAATGNIIYYQPTAVGEENP